jgi:enterochelin esterase-like enzyme
MKVSVSRVVVPAVASVALAVVAPVAASSARTDAGAPSHATSDTTLTPAVIHTGKAPTGYQVTFRYDDPSATRVQIKGEWYFGNPYQLAKLAGTSTTDVVQTPGRLPSQWQQGDIPMPYPNSTAANWPVIDMTEIGHSGVWTYTTPLPSGIFSYGFFVNCSDPTQATCTQVVDPNNPPWNPSGTGVDTISMTRRSQVYVPPDPKFRTQDLSWQAPNPRRGSLADVTYPAPTSLTPAGHNFLGVYTPPGYDPHRAQPYPTLYMLAPDDEVAWTTQGALANILDNFIDDGEIQPMILVSVNLRGFPASSDSSVGASNLIDNVIPFVAAHYNVSTSASQRALGSLGNAGSVVHQMLYNHTGEFGYYGAWAFSAGQAFTLPAAADLTAGQIAALRKVSILIGGGYEDPWHYFHASEIATLTSVGVPVHPDFVLSGHDWYTWRIIAKDFITRVAFFPPPAG